MPYTTFTSGNSAGATRIANLNLKLTASQGSGTSAAPAIGTLLLPDGTVGVPYAYQNDIAAPSITAPITYSITSGSLPPGLSLTSPDSSREWRISGTPTTAGSYTFTLQAANADGSDSQSLTIVIDAGSGEEAAYGFAG